MKLFPRDRLNWRAEAEALTEIKVQSSSTGCKSLDVLLGSGLPRGMVTHAFGPAGVGKTNLGISAAVSCATRGGKVLYVDTEGGFRPERFMQISTKETIAKNVFIKRVRDFAEQQELIRGLHTHVRQGVELLVFDSLTALYRLHVEGDRENILSIARELARQLALLSKLAQEKNVAVLVTNQVYASFDQTESGGVAPVGGDSLLYWAKVSMELQRSKKPGERIAILRKHPFAAEGARAEFKLTEKGVETLK